MMDYIFPIDSTDSWGIVGLAGPPAAFNPTAINATQWVLAAKAMGAGAAVMTARHGAKRPYVVP